MDRDGYRLFPPDPAVARWARAAHRAAVVLSRDPVHRAAQLRHGGSWFVGLDLLPNDAAGAVEGVPLAGDWQDLVPVLPLHRAQISIVYSGYPGQDAADTDAQHRYRINRAAAHVDGLFPSGPDRRRFAREYHAYLLGLPLTDCAAAPTVVWAGSHRIMQAALQRAIGDAAPGSVDVTDAYQAARREVFATCDKVALRPGIGGAMLLHRFSLHGTDPWGDAAPDAPDGRITAFFRPEITPQDWLAR